MWKLQNLIDGTEITINKTALTIGRNVSADIRIENIRVSRNQATIFYHINKNLFVTDHKSTNGTFVNDKKVTAATLEDGDTISFGGDSKMVRDPGFQKCPFLFKVIKNESTQPVPAETAEMDSTIATTSNFNSNETNSSSNNVKTCNNVESSVENNSSKMTPFSDVVIVCEGTHRDNGSNSNSTVIPGKNNNPFSMNEKEDYIIISDGEDDDDIPCSQFYQISQHIKKESVHGENDHIFQVIKEELEYFDSREEVVVDLTNDVEPIVNTQDLLNLLECPSNASASGNIENSDQFKTDAIEPPISKEINASIINVPVTEEEQIFKVPSNPIEPFEGCSRMSKPPLIEPHTIESKRRKQPSKRKSIEVEMKSSKKGENAKKVKLNVSNRNKNIELQQLRKQKLKELVCKTSEDPKIVKNNLDNGNLEEEFLSPQKLKFSNIKYTSIDPGSSSSKSSLHDNKKTSSSRNNLPSTNNLPSSINNKGKKPNLPLAEDENQFIWNKLPNREIRPPVTNHFIMNVDNYIFDILQWNVGWLLQQRDIDMTPPVNMNNPYYFVPKKFNDFDHYVNVFLPLIKLEIWQTIFHMTFKNDDSAWDIGLKLVRKNNKVWFLDCEYECGLNEITLRNEDFCLLQVKLKDSSNYYMYTCFAYVKSVQDSKRLNNNGKRTVKITLIVKDLLKEIHGECLKIKVCANIGFYVKLMKTVKYLKSSSICHYVLNPIELAHTMPITSSIKNSDHLIKLQSDISNIASNMALRNSPGFYLINGPPGTGKSSVIVKIVLEILNKSKINKCEPRILLTAPSNAAIDGLLVKLNHAREASEKGLIRTVRVGPHSSISSLANKFSLKFLTQKEIIKEKHLVQLPDYKKVFHNQMSQDDFLRNTLGNQYAYEYGIRENKILIGANIICTTLSSCINYILARKNNLKYTCCIIDEATQCSEIECLLPIQLGINKFILVGDPQQLAAVVINQDAHKYGFGKSLFSRIMDNIGDQHDVPKEKYPISLLNVQYRMKQEICNYPNRAFYGGKLKTSHTCRNPIIPLLKPYMLFSLTQVSNNDEYTNLEEVNLIKTILETLKNTVKEECRYSIGIITPYNAQKDLIIQDVKAIKFNSNVNIFINTVDSFQGAESDIVIISCVRYNTNYFLDNKNRLNVALTRAKQALYVLGNYTLFKQCPELYKLREDAKERKCLLDIKTNLKDIPTIRSYIVM
ncbi:unnamed protein product [Phyllotreta striolata]|uniref:FHA domain-containing protein n=1 Tax=Phyllotreta striolata TaxID=444603 RepID=A0A9N9TH12_PHYSR|nr:unnamed protein product [Phyllotreta striolata]